MTATRDTEHRIIDKILKNEGQGWNRDENSYRGIMRKTYKEFQKDTGTRTPHSELGSHSETVYAFYRWYLEKKCHVWELPVYLQYMHADFGVNVPEPAVKTIQKIVRTAVDGIWGPNTRKAVASFFKANTPETRGGDFVKDLLRFYDAERRKYYERLVEERPEEFQRYLAGWLARCDRVLSTSIRCSGGE